MTRPPKLELKGTLTGAVTYYFRTTEGSWSSWALCTVNDATGELLITSYWGSWSHRWNADPRSLWGCASLTGFIGSRGNVDYIADKLQRERRRGRRFSAAGTTKALRRELCERRLDQGREAMEIGARVLDYEGRRCVAMTREDARHIWNELGEVADEVGDGSESGDLYFDRVSQILGFHEHVTDNAVEYIVTEQTPEDRALRDIILPALISACRDRQPINAASDSTA